MERLSLMYLCRRCAPFLALSAVLSTLTYIAVAKSSVHYPSPKIQTATLATPPWATRYDGIRDLCQNWRETNRESGGALHTSDEKGDYNWWQLACLMERDWETVDYHCTDLRYFSQWPICFDEPYNPIKKDRKCIVYSFGIAFNFRFDDALAAMNCTVFSFDPSMGVKDHIRGQRVHFMNLGLGDKDEPNFIPRIDKYVKNPSSRWNIKKLSSIMKSLGHSDGDLTILKFDIEVNEWAVLRNLLSEHLLEKIPHVLVEWHIFKDSPDKSRYGQMYSDYMRFKSLGFSKVWMLNCCRNHSLHAFRTQSETSWVNTRVRV